MKTVVVSIGGSVVLSDEADSSFLQKLTTLFKKISEEYKLFVIVGGGSIARRYIQLGRQLGFDEDTLDLLGIDVTRVNARIITNLLGISNKEIPHTTSEALKLNLPIVVMGGTDPKHSTDLVGAEIAEKTRAVRFVNATNVDGIYDKDPKKFRDAKQLKEVTIDSLIAQYGTTWGAAGKNIFMDEPALAIIKRAKLTTYIVNGKRLDQLEKALTGQPFDGTTILV
ncbi:MAG TPA: UMP kinase [Thermoplasmata archaeon]|jgi:uridylate kinase|nr:MAG TPA: UMP kinase [Thermoplasmata archaeon]